MNLEFPKNKANFGNADCTNNYHILGHYASYSIDHLHNYMKTYIFKKGMDVQKDYTLGVAIMASLSELTVTKMEKEKGKYTMKNPMLSEEIELGLMMIKVYLMLAMLDTGGIVLIAGQ